MSVAGREIFAEIALTFNECGCVSGEQIISDLCQTRVADRLRADEEAAIIATHLSNR